MAISFLLAGSFLGVFISILAALPAQAEVKVTIGYAAISPRIIPLVIAQEQRLFQKYGIEARLVLN